MKLQGPIEVEIKVKMSNPDEMREQFKSKDGVYRCSLIHEDTYFNMPKGLRDFRKSDEALRIRKSIEFNKDRFEYGEVLEAIFNDLLTKKSHEYFFRCS